MITMQTVCRRRWLSLCITGFAGLKILFNSCTLGSVIAWGSAGSQTNVPLAASNAIAISAGYSSAPSLAIKADGTVLSWSQAAPLAGLSNVMEVAAGFSSGGVALKANGTVVGWDTGYDGNFSTVSNIVSIEKDDMGAALLRADGTVVRVEYGGVSYPTGLSNIVSLVPFNYGFIALRADGTLYIDSQAAGWGIPQSTNVMALAAGGYRAGQGLMLKRDGSLVGWGPTNLPPGRSKLPRDCRV